MLKLLTLKGVGPAEVFGPVEFAPRLNFITGDNGLGKSFLLDAAWWVLTRTWARGIEAVPRESATSASIGFAFSKVTAGDKEGVIPFDGGIWRKPKARPSIPGVVIYAGVDGSFSAWDPARNYWSDQQADAEEKIRAFNFSPDQVWKGAVSDKGTNICNGLIHDWVRWQRTSGDSAFKELTLALDALSPSGIEKLSPGEPCHIGALDETEYPTLRMSYGLDVPLVHASAGMRRIAALAYMLVWTWNGHKRACRQRKIKPAKEIIFLVDEVECHLHPQWQRRIVPALLKVVQAMTGEEVAVQLLIATHSPLVLASVEPDFDQSIDAVFNINLEAGEAHISREIWAKQGDVVNWLVSESFGLRQARSVDAELAIEAAEAWMRDDRKDLPAHLDSEKEIHEALIKALPETDHFWPRWIVSVEKSVEDRRRRRQK
ncbi:MULTISPECIES: AAA family ATPase [unclassified Pseudomonas]|uniref:AAA family ATPase n=1 Tax=unclassified Pseudomonas TaxID=196821 RepID=UPI00119A5769|nr:MULTISPECIES: ATP-binding protein [unclassified Pseudomonas]TWC16380.1 putative AbiEii toxin of type IV toxin-antitoxin system [Pseudomonas sp. SJZ074]TWC18007.1 putative AbiEii toxin of type IV toxin-antitoxin system [Pseudomonas sp. SJZ075]TWC34283.1 putative AbiEii toxin of type IV toxin-antitoxin system [Pseudomonas sp. SJZ078]TWC34539.1 putative AbiEii toxin of type IV toxin-antitoxin system [Pseudomonas sp. SJZ085]TWC55172.1 putative AbiEii toxin of type IV toxin-antitoxin system [Pse